MAALCIYLLFFSFSIAFINIPVYIKSFIIQTYISINL